MEIMEAQNPQASKTWPYVVAGGVIPAVAILGIVSLLLFTPDRDNSVLIGQIIGFAITITMSTFAYLKSADTREVVNSRMDEFKRTLQLSANTAAAAAHAEGEKLGREAANQRTDILATKADDLATKADAIHVLAADTHTTLKTHDQWERDRVATLAAEATGLRTKDDL